jgi:hypothetical protein
MVFTPKWLLITMSPGMESCYSFRRATGGAMMGSLLLNMVVLALVFFFFRKPSLGSDGG